MTLDSRYVRISDLFEDTVSRSSQLASLAAVLHDAMISQDSDPLVLSNTAWLLSRLLWEQHKVIAELHDAHRKDFLLRQDK